MRHATLQKYSYFYEPIWFVRFKFWLSRTVYNYVLYNNLVEDYSLKQCINRDEMLTIIV